jgi:acetone carboxylase gamma subunit
MRGVKMNGKRSIKKSERNWPVKKSIRLRKAAESAVEELFPEDVLRNLKDKRYRAVWGLDKDDA